MAGTDNDTGGDAGRTSKTEASAGTGAVTVRPATVSPVALGAEVGSAEVGRAEVGNAAVGPLTAVDGPAPAELAVAA